MIQREWTTGSPEETRTLAADLLDSCPDHRIFAFWGDLGAGKTTLIQAICEQLGVADTVKSPTFSIINVYDAEEDRIFHFDFYRIEEMEEVFDIGFEEYVDSGEYCLMEWPERIEPLLPEETVHVRIEHAGENQRRIVLQVPVIE